MINYPVIDLNETGNNIKRLRKQRGFSVAQLQEFFGFENPNAIYKWQKGASLPTVDNLLALSVLFNVNMNEILVYGQDFCRFVQTMCSLHKLFKPPVYIFKPAVHR